jgi:hypothetical protein
MLQACTFLGISQQQQDEKASKCLSQLIHQNSALKRCKGIIKASTAGFDSHINERIAFISEAPHQLRAELLSPFGAIGKPFLLICNESQLVVTGHFFPEPYRFKPDSFLIKKVIPIPLMPKEFISCLHGHLPIDNGTQARFEKNSSQQILWLTKGLIWKKKQKIVFHPDSQNVLSLETYNHLNSLLYKITFSDYRTIDSFLIPFKMIFSNEEDQSITIAIQSYWANKPISSTPFQTEIFDKQLEDKGVFSCISNWISALLYH